MWRGARVWHETNSSAGSSSVTFEALPELEYMVERLCRWNVTAGYGPTQMSPSPADPATGGKARVGGIIGGWLCDAQHD